ncbi:MAG: mechanosensitive ion channel, partial [Actinobacteria bacterium]
MVAMPTLAAPRFDFERWFDDNGVRIITILVTAVVVTIVTRFLVRRFRRKLEGKPSLTQELNLQRATTLTHALSTALVVVIWTLAFLLTLGTLEVNLAPFLASAGVAGVALGFGAQSVVKDTLSGFFILLENQFGVGDVLEILTTAGPI